MIRPDGGRRRSDAHPQYETNLHVPAKRLQDMPVLLEAANKLKAKHRGAGGDKKHAHLRSEARQLLYQASLNPYWPVARLYELMGAPSPRNQKAIREELQGGKFARFAEPRIGSRKVLLIELLEPAWRLLGAPPEPLVGRGSLEHRTMANWIRLVGVKRGHSTICEAAVPGGPAHAVDAGWLVGERWQVFEVVVTSSDNLLSHLESVLLTPGSPVDKATVVALQKGKLNQLKARIDECQALASILDRVDYQPVEVFEKELWL